MKVKVSEATPLQLDWMVAKCLASVHKDAVLNGTVMHGWWISGLFVDPNYWISLDEFKPTTNWSQGGPVFSKARIGAMFHPEWDSDWGAWPSEGDDHQEVMGETELIAKARCFVASRLGAEMDVPEDLK